MLPLSVYCRCVNVLVILLAGLWRRWVGDVLDSPSWGGIW
jgi:hypothetical protein